jgi:hypothetical protein
MGCGAMRSGLRLKPAALPVTPPSYPVVTVVVVDVHFVSCCCDLVSASWCTLFRGMLKFSSGVMVY